jgi:hypothetical protein
MFPLLIFLQIQFYWLFLQSIEKYYIMTNIRKFTLRTLMIMLCACCFTCAYPQDKNIAFPKPKQSSKTSTTTNTKKSKTVTTQPKQTNNSTSNRCKHDNNKEDCMRCYQDEQTGLRIADEFIFGLEIRWDSSLTDSQKDIIRNLIQNMVSVEGGTFDMGSEGTFQDKEHLHTVTVSSFRINKYEVSQKEWEAVMGNNPSEWILAELPVERVSWDDCQEFIKKLNKITGLKFRMPTEAEWEYAARGGNKSAGYTYSGSNDINEVGWYALNINLEVNPDVNNKTHPCGLKKPNELGLYDMSGNVFEWCSDYMGYFYYKDSPATNPKGPAEGTHHIQRGGCWYDDAKDCTVSNRGHVATDNANNMTGLRLAHP